MPNKRYNAGANFERRVIKFLRGQGYRATRSAGSHTPIDIMCGIDGKPFGIQCQLDKYFPPVKIEALVDECRAYGAMPMLCWRGESGKIEFKEIR